MAAGDLKQAQFGIAFAFSRSEIGSFVDADGAVRFAAIDAPRFDHGDDGSRRGLLVTAGSDLGRADRTAIDPLILPAALVDGPRAQDREATVFHAFVRLGAPEWQVERRAWYSRNAKVTVDGLLAQQGNHLSIGVVSGFRANAGGFVRFRGKVWQLAGLLLDQASGAALTTAPIDGRPIVVAGAEAIG